MEKIEKKIDTNVGGIKKNNQGFSLVELIIVIAIMAILVGVVGTQVVPYIEHSREAKDYQVLSSYCTAATSAYSTKAASLTSTGTITITLSTSATEPDATSDAGKILAEIRKLTGYGSGSGSFSALTSSMESQAGKKITSIVIEIDQANRKITVKTTCPDPYAGTFEDIVGKL